MRNIKLILEYDGTHFKGWQTQLKERTVQGVLEQCLDTLLQDSVKIIAAGRTDTGVHARGQVINFKTRSKLLLRDIYRGLNSLLPKDVVVRKVLQVPIGFHARFDAISRKYLYRIATNPTAIHRHFVWVIIQPLDLRLMQQAAENLLGTHDFRAFCREAEGKNNYLCTIEEVILKRSREEIHFEIAANRFLHAMIRIIMGRLVDVGRRKVSPEEFAHQLDTEKERRTMVIAPPQGLCLLEISYPRGKAVGERREK